MSVTETENRSRAVGSFAEAIGGIAAIVLTILGLAQWFRFISSPLPPSPSAPPW